MNIVVERAIEFLGKGEYLSEVEGHNIDDVKLLSIRIYKTASDSGMAFESTDGAIEALKSMGVSDSIFSMNVFLTNNICIPFQINGVETYRDY